MSFWPVLATLLALGGNGAEEAIETRAMMPSECLAEIAAERDRKLHRRYLYETNGRQGVRFFGQEGSNESILIPGSDRLVIVWHGFMASPPEMAPLGRALHESLGATVYIPLIPGFGSGARVAGRFGLEAWRQGVRESIEAAVGCHSQIALVGYSIGGGLVADLLLSSARDLSNRVRSVVLLSPYIETAAWMAPGLKTRPRAAGLHLLRSVLRLRRLRLSTLHRLSRGRYRDLDVLLAQPEVYDQSFSLKAGLNMLRLTRGLRGLGDGARSALPTMLALSEADQTVGWAFSETFVRRHFPVSEAEIRYPRASEIPHQIVVPEVNPEHDKLFAAIADFLERQFETGA